MPQKSVIVGTAGHIDHGKTALVKALTGIDADRLEEEKRRGITIDLGFAHTELQDSAGNAVRFGFVDVPGHEKFVRNMLSGIGGIDMVLLVIAADEGIKPQTREHFEICKLLGIKRGITVISKSDKVSASALAATCANVSEFLRGSFLDTKQSPVVAVSASSGAGLDELKQAMTQIADELVSRSPENLFRLPIDRVFTMTGFGTVVTGTMVSGSVRVGEEVEVQPGGIRFRVRGLQVHNHPADAAHAGERVAINLASAQKTDLARGMSLVVPGFLRATSMIDAQLRFLEDSAIKTGVRFHFHSFTAETIATLQRYDPSTGFARLRLSTPMLLLPGDRFILRKYSPVTTVGGGEVLDATVLKSSSDSFLSSMSLGDKSEKLFARVERRGTQGFMIRDAVAETGWTQSEIERLAKELNGRIVRTGDMLLAAEHFQSAAKHLLEAVSRFHEANPLVVGPGSEEIRAGLHLSSAVFNSVVEILRREKKLEESGEVLRLAGRGVVMKDDESAARHTIERAFANAGLEVPAMNDVLAGIDLDKARAHKIVTLLLRDRVLIRLGDELVFHSAALSALRTTVRAHKAKSPTIDVAQFKEITQVSRKYAIPLLEFLDRERVTRRQGDVRVIL
jgi:selenocysteine-specific elongation factor